MPRDAEERQELERRVAAIQGWYHAIDLGDGIVTPGPFCMADYVREYELPDDMSGMRALDDNQLRDARNLFVQAHKLDPGPEPVDVEWRR